MKPQHLVKKLEKKDKINEFYKITNIFQLLQNRFFIRFFLKKVDFKSSFAIMIVVHIELYLMWRYT